MTSWLYVPRDSAFDGSQSFVLRSFLEHHVEAAKHDHKQAVEDNREDYLLCHAAVIVLVAATTSKQSTMALNEIENRRLLSLHFDFLYYYKKAISLTINLQTALQKLSKKVPKSAN